ncbi:MAG: iron ABC transporter permease [Thermaerobacterales bacterium]
MNINTTRSAPSAVEWSPGLVLWPLAVAIALAMLVPVFYLVIRALEADAGVLSLVAQPRTLHLLGRTLLLAGVVTALSLVIAVPLAWLTTRTDLPFRRFWTVALAVPLAIPSYLGAYTLIAALGPRGMLQQVLDQFIGMDRLPDLYGFPGAVLALTLFSYPYAYLNIRAAIQRLDPALEEASRSLNQGGWRTFWRVIFPNLRPAMAAGGLLIGLYVFSDFGAVSVMQYDTFTRAIFVQYQAAFDRTYGAILGLMLVVCTVGVLAVAMKLRSHSRRRYHRLGPGSHRRAVTASLGAWRWPALALCAGVAFMSLVLPATVVMYWLLRGLAAGQAVQPVYLAALNSFWVSGLGALACVVLAAPVALVISRSNRAGARWLEGSVYVGYALPGVVVALGLVFFGIQVARPFYQTFFLLIFAYVVMFLPQAVGAWRNSLLQVSPHIEEAARSLGNSPWQVLRKVTLPLIRPGMLAGGALVFLTVIKELPATLLLSPIGFRTLATVVWSATDEAFYTRAAPAALLLLVASFVSVFFLFADERLPRKRKSSPAAVPAAGGMAGSAQAPPSEGSAASAARARADRPYEM